MAKRYQAPRGTADVLPADAPRWRMIEDAFMEVMGLYGYHEIRTPVFEDTELFVRSSGEDSEVVSKQMYSFIDKGDRPITLKPEGTAPAIRAFLEHSLGQSGQISRLWYITPIFRYERPQKGRMRQAHQVGCELIGTQSPEADAEIIEVTAKFYERIGITGVSAQVNSIGRQETRTRFREAILKHIASWLKDQSEEDQARATRNPLRLFDSKDAAIAELMATAPLVTDCLEDASKEHFERVQQLLTEAGIPYSLNPRIVRGLDYYTDTVFEVQSDALGSQSSLCGGGRYDGLIQELGGPATPAVGVAMGIERALIVQEALGVSPEAAAPPVFVINIGDEAEAWVRSTVRALHEAGIPAMADLDHRSPKSQLRQADKAGARACLLAGEDELREGVCVLRRMDTGEEQKLPTQDAIATLAQAAG